VAGGALRQGQHAAAGAGRGRGRDPRRGQPRLRHLLRCGAYQIHGKSAVRLG